MEVMEGDIFMKHILEGSRSDISQQSFIAPTASVLGDVRIGDNSSVWFGSILRGDINYIQIGKYSNIQDLSVLHVELDKPCIVGNYVTVGHHANLHGCEIGDNVLIGIGAIILSGAKIGANSIVGAGSVVTENSDLAGGYLYIGAPAKPKRELTAQEVENLKSHAEKYWLIASKWSDKISEEELG